MTSRRILVIEDDAAIRRGVADALRFAGYDVTEAARFDEARDAAFKHSYDLMLLDLVLPGGGGLDILRDVRDQRPTQPIIILTARGDEDDRVRGLTLGADDYVVKPFSVRELTARVEAVLRRSPDCPEAIERIEVDGTGTIDLTRRQIRFNDSEPVDLSERETQLLRYLATHSNRPVSRDELLANVWGLDVRGLSTRTIDMHVARLRDKLRDDPSSPKLLLTVRGKGYLFQST